jgi:predicted nicotinamide N-methyase
VKFPFPASNPLATGAIVLAKYLEKKYGNGKGSGDDFKGKKVLEIGSGTGVAGIVCAQFWNGAEFTLTDQKQVLELIEENVRRNSERIPALKEHVKVQELDWGGSTDHLSPSPPYDWIIACECVAPIFRLDLLLETLKMVTGAQTTILMAYEHRHDSCRVNFFQKAEEFGFKFERIPESELHQGYMAEDIELWLIRRPM